MKAINIVFIGVWLILAGSCFGQTLLDWDDYDTSDWADSTLEGTFTNVQNSAIDVYVVVYGDVFNFQNGAPRIRAVDASSPNGEQFMQFGNTDWDSNSRSMNISFSFFETGTKNPVTMSSIEFQLIDVDASTGYNDRVTLSGSPSITESVTSGRTQPNHDISGSVVQAWTGSGAVATNSVYITPLNDFQGALNVSYTGVSSFTFTYDNGTGTPSDPTGQNIGIYDISFVVAPEPGTGLMLLLAAGIFSSVRRRK